MAKFLEVPSVVSAPVLGCNTCSRHALSSTSTSRMIDLLAAVLRAQRVVVRTLALLDRY